MTREEFIKQTAEQQLACAGYTLQSSCPPRPHNATECGWEWVGPSVKLVQAQAEFAAVRGAVVEARAELRDAKRLADDGLNQALRACSERDEARRDRDSALKARDAARQSKERHEQEAAAAISMRDAAMTEHARVTDSIRMESVRLSPFSPWLTSDVATRVYAGTSVDVDPVRSTLAGLGPMKPGDVVVWPKRPNTNDTGGGSYIRTNEGWVCLSTGTRYSVSSLDGDTANWVRAKVRV